MIFTNSKVKTEKVTRLNTMNVPFKIMLTVQGNTAIG